MNPISFSEDNFADALSNDHSSAAVIRNKRHFAYFMNYFSDDGIGARTMVIEDKYISKDYLHDHASYYAFCFKDYEKFCKRIHFFSTVFDKKQLEEALLNPNDEKFWEGYLGFIVVKPLPITVVGYTVLSVYPNDDKSRKIFWGRRDYKIHFFGKELRISSLAFQEQDSVLAACATTAIWCMLNKACTDHHTILKVPSEITKDADVLSNDGSRLFPNKGLDTLQICQAINNAGLAPEVRFGTIPTEDHFKQVDSFVSTAFLKRLVNAYEYIGIPIIFGIKVPNGESYGYHAVTVAGHKMVEEPLTKSKLMFVGERIDKFYVHDDQFGPFAWVKFLDEVGIESPWTTAHPQHLPTYVTTVVIPLYPKIRISYEDIEVLVYPLDGIIKLAFELPDDAPIYWDVKLDYSQSFKRYVAKSELEDTRKLQLLEKSMPKYLWIVTCYVANNKFMTFTFDATDVSNGMLGLEIICYFKPDVNAHLHGYITRKRADLATLFQTAGGINYIEHLLKEVAKWM